MTIGDAALIATVNMAIVYIWHKLRQRKKSQFTKRFNEINALMEKKEYSAAISALQKLEKLVPDVAYEMMGQCYYDTGDQEKARELYEKSLSIDSDSDTAYLGIAHIEMDKRDYSKAESSLKKAIEINNDNYVAMYYLATIYNIWGRHLEAANLLENAIAKGLTMREAYSFLQENYEAAGKYDDGKRIANQLELLINRGN